VQIGLDGPIQGRSKLTLTRTMMIFVRLIRKLNGMASSYMAFISQMLAFDGSFLLLVWLCTMIRVDSSSNVGGALSLYRGLEGRSGLWYSSSSSYEETSSSTTSTSFSFRLCLVEGVDLKERIWVDCVWMREFFGLMDGW